MTTVIVEFHNEAMDHLEQTTARYKAKVDEHKSLKKAQFPKGTYNKFQASKFDAMLFCRRM